MSGKCPEAIFDPFWHFGQGGYLALLGYCAGRRQILGRATAAASRAIIDVPADSSNKKGVTCPNTITNSDESTKMLCRLREPSKLSALITVMSQ